MRSIDLRDRLIVALDVGTPEEATALVQRLGDRVTFYKIGLELAYGGGLPLAAELAASGKKIFLDLKLHDIPNTVERATAQAARCGAHLLTVHAYPQTMRAARAGAAGTSLAILGVTVMTSYDDADLREAGYAAGVADTVTRRAAQAAACGIDGLILSAGELAAARTAAPTLLRVTPGIRPSGAATNDQKRVTTPAEAITAGADHLVVGRPITAAPDPARAAEAIVADIAAALA